MQDNNINWLDCREWMTIEEVARIIGVSRCSVRNWSTGGYRTKNGTWKAVESHGFPKAVRFGRSIRISRSDFNAWVKFRHDQAQKGATCPNC